MGQVDVWWGRREVALAFEEGGLEMDDVFAQRVVLGLQALVLFLQGVELADLLLELLDISFFSLAECSLW
jgi:hypothetical protein